MLKWLSRLFRNRAPKPRPRIVMQSQLKVDERGNVRVVRVPTNVDQT